MNDYDSPDELRERMRTGGELAIFDSFNPEVEHLIERLQAGREAIDAYEELLGAIEDAPSAPRPEDSSPPEGVEFWREYNE